MLRKLFFCLPAPFRLCIQLFYDASKQHISAHAAGICFFLLLALFPMAILTCTVLRAVGLTAADLLCALRPLLPSALYPLIKQLTEGFFAARSVGALSMAALLALWSASRGIYGIMRALNAVCRFEDRRGFLRRRLICLFYLILTLLALPAALLAHMMGYTLLLRAGRLFPLLQHLGTFLVLVLIHTGIYYAFPARKLRLRSCLIGSTFSALLWQLFTAVFSLYAQGAQSYSTFYGSLRFCALGLLWLYFCTMILLFGGCLSAEIHHRLKKPNTNM